LLRGQIEGSNCVLVNKTDLVDTNQLKAVEKSILEFEPQAVVLNIAAAQTVPTEVWQTVISSGGDGF
jgi:G3E family GTPase